MRTEVWRESSNSNPSEKGKDVMQENAIASEPTENSVTLFVEQKKRMMGNEDASLNTMAVMDIELGGSKSVDATGLVQPTRLGL